MRFPNQVEFVSGNVDSGVLGLRKPLAVLAEINSLRRTITYVSTLIYVSCVFVRTLKRSDWGDTFALS